MIIQAIPENIWNQMDKVEEEAIAVAIKALEELNLYKQNRLCLIPSNVYEKQCEELDKLKAKATPLKPLYSDYDDNGYDEIIPYKAVCPKCLHEFEFGTWNDEDNHHCVCGQRMDWVGCPEFGIATKADDKQFGQVDSTICTFEPCPQENMETQKHDEMIMKLIKEYARQK